MGILELCLEKCIVVALIIAGFVGWTFLVRHVSTLVNIERHCGEVIFSFRFSLECFSFSFSFSL